MGKNFRISIAPMIDYTDRHYRYMMRLITKRSFLYTEMIAANAVLLGDRDYLLGYSEEEHPISLQLGGNDPLKLAEASKVVEDWGYDEVNLNVGCPSERVQEGLFGACLMAKPELVAESLLEMKRAVDIPVTVKHRIGIDNLESYEDLYHFVKVVLGSGCDRFIVHARIAILGGLSPKDNRKIPPLRYEDVYRLKRDFPNIEIEINGGIKSLGEMEEQLGLTDGVMMGRLAYEDPFIFSGIDSLFYGDEESDITRSDVVMGMLPYIEEWTAKGHPLVRISRHMLNLWKGQPRAKSWRRYLSENPRIREGAVNFMKEGLEMML